jgi:hypothetical protein
MAYQGSLTDQEPAAPVLPAMYSTRSSLPSSAAATPVDTPIPRPNGSNPAAIHRRLTSACRRCICAAATSARWAWSSWGKWCAEHGHDRVADVLHHRAAPAQDGGAHGPTVLLQLLRQDGRRGAFGDGGVATDVRHQHRHGEALGVVGGAWIGAQLLGQPSRQPRQLLGPVRQPSRGFSNDRGCRRRLSARVPASAPVKPTWR